MEKQNHQDEICQQILEEIIDGKSDDITHAHLENCPDCRQVAASLAQLATLDSALDSSGNPGLKKRVLNRLSPIMTARQHRPQPQAHPAAKNSYLAWLLGLSFAGAMAVIMFFGNQPMPLPERLPVTPVKTAAVDSQTFTLSLNQQPPATVSMDSPVSLFNNETALIRLPDNSTIQLEGPARLTVKPRGFHLLSGKAQPALPQTTRPLLPPPSMDGLRFSARFSHALPARLTPTVAVERGKVRVIDNSGRETILIAGEKTRITTDDDAASKTEGIPRISEE
jgi:hypothetical protein